MSNERVPSLPGSQPVFEADVEDSRFGWSTLATLTAAAVSISTVRAAATRGKRSTVDELRDGIVDHELRAAVTARNKIAMLQTSGRNFAKESYGKKKSKSKMPKEKVKAPAAPAIEPEETFFEGPPSKTEMIIPGASVLTVVGVIPFSASVARQVWTRYKITNRRLEVASGFQGKDVVQVLYREIVDVKWLRRFGGAAGDIVLSLQDGSKLEVRSVPEFDRNLAFIMSKLDENTVRDCGYPDKPARDFFAENPDSPKPEIEEAEASA
jgi:hypothetical protein